MATIVPYRPVDFRSLCAAVTGVLAKHGVIGIPTETYYGLGVNPSDAEAVRRLFAVKGRPDGKPVPVLIGARDQLDRLVAGRPPAAELLMERFWPGPLTVVFPASPELPDELTGGTGTVGVRWTSCAPLAALLRAVGPLTGTSANRSGQPPFKTADAVDRVLGAEIDLIVDTGSTPGGAASTVVRVESEVVEVLREGAVESAALERVLLQEGFRLKSFKI